jgi:hypothetical protein
MGKRHFISFFWSHILQKRWYNKGVIERISEFCIVNKPPVSFVLEKIPLTK